MRKNSLAKLLLATILCSSSLYASSTIPPDEARGKVKKLVANGKFGAAIVLADGAGLRDDPSLRSELAIAERELAKENAAKVAASNAKSEAEQKAALKKLDGLKKSVDKIDRITWYEPKGIPAGPANKVLVYFGQVDAKTQPLRIKMMYYGSDWIFADSYILDGGGEQIRGKSRFERDNSSGNVWEWVDLQVDRKSTEQLVRIMSATDVTLRLEGKFRHDLKVSKAQRAAIVNVASIHLALTK